MREIQRDRSCYIGTVKYQEVSLEESSIASGDLLILWDVAGAMPTIFVISQEAKTGRAWIGRLLVITKPLAPTVITGEIRALMKDEYYELVTRIGEAEPSECNGLYTEGITFKVVNQEGIRDTNLFTTAVSSIQHFRPVPNSEVA